MAWKTVKILICLRSEWFTLKLYNHVKTNVLKKHFYYVSQIDGLLAVRMHQSNIPQDKTAVFPHLSHFFEIKFCVWMPAAAIADMVG